MGFREARKAIIEALLVGRFQHEERAQAQGKNLLASGDVTVDEVVAVLGRCRGNQHATSPHHFVADQEVHVFRPVEGVARWYIKAYLVEVGYVEAIFISVHK